MIQDNIYIPKLMRIKEIKVETPDVKTFKLEFLETENKDGISFTPGQFGIFSVFGVGEAPFCITSSPQDKEYICISVKRIGIVTEALHELDIGYSIGFRGPYGQGFSLDELKGKNIIFVAGGIGVAALRSLILYCCKNSAEFSRLVLIYGARTPQDLVYKEELEEWSRHGSMEVILTIDLPVLDKTWQGRVGFVPQILEQLSPSPENAVAIICGPPVMIRFSINVLEKLGFDARAIRVTLEMKMKCGLGKCGRCNIGNKYICRDGPVFSWENLKNLPQEY